VDFLPWNVARHGVGGWSLELALSDDAAIDALHRMDTPGHWLLSTGAPTNFGGAFPPFARPHDVVRFDAVNGVYGPFFCGAAVAGAIPDGSNVDALYLDGSDAGDLIVSFDVPTTIGLFTFEPSALVRYTRVGPGCGGWSLVGLEVDLAAVAATFHPPAANVNGAALTAGLLLFTLDIPTDLAPSAGPPTYLPGQIVSWDGLVFDLFEDLQTAGVPGWPIASLVDGLACQANPGRLPVTLTVGKSTLTPGDIELTWDASCAAGAEDYGIYEGTIGSWYDHVQIDCADAGGDRTEEVTPAPSSHYYLVVPFQSASEGSYGLNSALVERPQAALPGDRCIVPQTLTPCPP
jgi:hypothetical protein